MISHGTLRCLALAASVIGLATCTGLAVETPIVSVFDKPAPESMYDLRVIERTANDLSKRLAQCTVGLEVGMAHGSGVIISKDGYVLTAAHVVGRPGRDVRIKLPDGRTAEGKTLGIHTVADGGLVKISGGGDWPHAELAPVDEVPQVGAWCLAIGHPLGFDAQRDPPVRLGRIVRALPNILQTDCPITGGDSGGPLFDMQGRVIGIHSRIGEGITENFHGPVVAFLGAWEQLVRGEIYPARPPSRFLAALDIDGDGQLTRAELPAGVQQRVFDRLTDKFNLDPAQSHSVTEFANDVLRWRPSPRLRLPRIGAPEEGIDESLSPERLSRGNAIRNLFAATATQASRSTVRIQSDGEWVAWGTVVTADGYILTKASPLGSVIECEVAAGRTLPAKLAAVDLDYDLALLRIEASDLHSIRWSTVDLRTGSWLISARPNVGVASIGVNSVGARKITKMPAVLGVAIDDVTTPGNARVSEVSQQSGAAEAGIQPDDIIKKIMDDNVQSLDELRAMLGEFRAGDVVQVTIQRGTETLTLDVTLGARDEMSYFGTSRMNGPLSRLRDGFPMAIQHDSVLRPNQCGGPVVDTSGGVVGINIARANRIATYVVPQDVLRAFVKKHTSGVESQDTDA